MSKNHLMEAAADILSRSHAAAPKEEMHKAAGEVQDLGGSTPSGNISKKFAPQTGPGATPPGKPAPVGQAPLDKQPEPEEIDPLDPKGGTGDSAENDALIAANKKRAGLAEETADEKDEDEDEDDEDEDDEDDKDEDDEDDKKDAEDFKKKLAEDVQAILQDESDLSAEFRTKIATIYEARVIDKINEIASNMQASFEQELAESIETLGTELTVKTNDYLNYVVEEWMGANELAIVSGLRSELVEEFIGGLHTLFAEHFIDVPENKVDLVEELAAKVETLESTLNEEIARGVSLKKQIAESKKSEILASVCEGLTAPAADKIRTLAESVEFTAEGDFRKKVDVLRENYFPTKVKLAEVTQLNEVVDMAPEVPAAMKAYADAIARQTIK